MANMADASSHLRQQPPPPPPPPRQIAVRNADVRMAGKALLQSVSTAFDCGHITAILGPNGAGKSTLMSLLTGQRLLDKSRQKSPAERGDVLWAGQPLAGHAPAQLARSRAFVAQDSHVAFEFTVREIVGLGRYPHRSQMALDEACIVDEALHTTRTAHLQNQLVSTLSGGEKARVQLARALAQVARPVAVSQSSGPTAERWLLLDEPTAALDVQHQHHALAAVQRWAATPATGAVAVLHDLNLALRYCQNCVLLDAGRVVASGPCSEVLTAAQIQSLWGVRAMPVQMQQALAEPTASRPEPQNTQKVPQKVLQYLFEPINTCTSSYQNDSELQTR